ncbi:7772_t:CDS:10 [Dentiscutata erythropus]|uniref:Translation initiation factor eIF2B subunit alpha n=1 Tax=Dentiscutata erythropus TaxID=1348616 RepID=A0A9N8YSP4_9GLOM|nr:7772_t:CDS:10 [Dentiscutata erythropus]
MSEENVKATDDAEQFDIVTCYQKFLKDDPDLSMPIAAIESLVELIKHSKATTLTEFMESLKDASQKLKSSVKNSISLSAGADLFLRFVTRTSHDVTNFEACREHLINSGKVLVEKAAAVREKIGDLGVQFIKDDATILIHSYSRVVMLLLQRAAACKKRFKVYVTESRPLQLGIGAAKVLCKSGIPATVIYDTAVGYIIDKVDAVFVGAEGVVENGGLINAIGTYQLAVVAKAANKPFYAVIESYKFVRLFPLNQYDLPTHTPDLLTFPDLEQHNTDSSEDEVIGNYEAINPTVDYTPPDYITLLCTDLGVLTPSGSASK